MVQMQPSTDSSFAPGEQYRHVFVMVCDYGVSFLLFAILLLLAHEQVKF